MPDDNPATTLYRLGKMEITADKLARDVDVLDRQQAVQREQINGAGGIVAAMDKLGKKVDGLNRALYAFAVSFVICAVTIAVAVGSH